MQAYNRIWNYCVKNAVPVNFLNDFLCVLYTQSSNNLVPNCQQYFSTNTGSGFQYYLCNAGYYYSADASVLCNTSCGDTMLIKAIEVFKYKATSMDSAFSLFGVNRPNICVSEPPDNDDLNYENCSVILPELFMQGTTERETTYVCGVCRSSFYPIMIKKYSVYLGPMYYYPTSPISYHNRSPIAVHPGVNFVARSAITFSDPTTTLDSINCDYFY